MRFQILGPLRVATGSGWTGVRARQQRLVLAILLIESGKVASTDRLMSELWGDRPPSSALNTVQAYVMRLRRLLGDAAGALLVTEGSGYRLMTTDDDVDSRVFTQLVRAGQQSLSAGRLSTATEQLGRAETLWRGPALSEVADTPAVAAEAAQLERLRLVAVETRMSVELGLGRHADVVGELARWVNAHPLVEGLRGQLMLALARCGRRSEALAAYQQGHTLLDDELGIPPMRELAELHQTILAGEPVPASTFERRVPAVVAVSPAVRPPTPNQLPPDIVDFVGRDDEVATITDALTAGPSTTAMPVLAMTGQGGVGKTTLTVHVAHRLRESFPDGQLYADLHGIEPDATDPAHVLARFLTALGMDGRALPTTVEERATRLRMLLADRRVLLVLDNAADERQVRPLLPGSATCAVLVTSRTTLTGLNARQFPLLPLGHEAAIRLLATIAGEERVMAEPALAEVIVARCDHLPLAVRIVGARLAARPAWPLARLAARLDDEARRLDELATGDLAVRASIDAIYVRLDPDTRRTLRMLALLELTDSPTWIVAALLDLPTARTDTLLERLVDAQLVTGTAAGTGHLRYRLHDLVGLYARERGEIEDGEEERVAALSRALGALLAVADVADRALHEHVVWDIPGDAPRRRTDDDLTAEVARDPLAWFDAERGTLVAAVGQAARTGLAAQAWEIAARGVGYHAHCGYYDDWLLTHQLASRVCVEGGDRLGAAVITRNLGYLRVVGVRVPAIDLDGAEAVFREYDQPHGVVDVCGLRALLSLRRGRLAEARTHARVAMEMAQALDYDAGLGLLWCLRASTSRQQGHYDEATRCGERSLALADGNGNMYNRVLALWELAGACQNRDTAAAVLSRLADAVEQCRGRRELTLEVYLLLAEAELKLRLGLVVPRQTLERCMAVFDQHSVLWGQTICVRLLGTVDTLTGRVAAGIEQLTRAVELARRMGNDLEQAHALTALGRAHQTDGDSTLAAHVWGNALALYDRIGNETESVAVMALLPEHRHAPRR
ncbi:AfsR/SARP family transcriptional regulator [Actinophytocola sp.]|uniref:AfsR/SARP family transcriptional regulator n=1 Tax=Actinophytocola sp. TaxID=1872138 RepID=UPI002D2B52A8|nr:BTAD domain-containing putative transcriptional regulator [Actinophytocola sp.]HYQ68760.1 BTAD domain-containing putative transcriptional regulator [Actinophytocola sp.]